MEHRHLRPVEEGRNKVKGAVTVTIPEGYTTGEGARDILGISEEKLARLLKAGREGKTPGLPWVVYPLDYRLKLIKLVDIHQLLGQTVEPPRAR